MGDTLIVGVAQGIGNLVDDGDFFVIGVLFPEISLQGTSFYALFLYAKSVAVYFYQSLVAHYTGMVEPLALLEFTLQGVTEQRPVAVFFFQCLQHYGLVALAALHNHAVSLGRDDGVFGITCLYRCIRRLCRLVARKFVLAHQYQ